MKYINLTKNKVAIVDADDFKWLSQWKWCYNGEYAVRAIERNKKHKTIMMHRVINKTPADAFTDHINRNKLDNRRNNLRTVNKSQNAINTNIRSDNSSGCKGVYWRKQRNKWRAVVWINKKFVSLGSFSKLEDAVVARKEAEMRWYV